MGEAGLSELAGRIGRAIAIILVAGPARQKFMQMKTAALVGATRD